jgi:hypothetical protein
VTAKLGIRKWKIERRKKKEERRKKKEERRKNCRSVIVEAEAPTV